MFNKIENSLQVELKKMYKKRDICCSLLLLQALMQRKTRNVKFLLLHATNAGHSNANQIKTKKKNKRKKKEEKENALNRELH